VLAVDVRLAGDAVDKLTAREMTTRAVCVLGSGLRTAERRRVGACVCVVRSLAAMCCDGVRVQLATMVWR
jgi:hypothetical protein